MAACYSASVAGGFDHWPVGVSFQASQHLFVHEEDSRDMVTYLWVCECVLGGTHGWIVLSVASA